MLERVDMRGQLTLRLIDKEGSIAHEQRSKNRIVKTGRRLVAELFGGVTAGAPPSQVTHMAVGTDGTAPSDDDSALHAQRDAANPITDITYTDFDEPVPNSAEVVKRTRVSLTAVFDFNQANGPDPLQEAGIFTAATGGVMYNRVVFQPVTKTDSFKLTLLWDIVF